MSDKEQIRVFEEELDRLILRMRAEYDLSIAGAVGVLELAKWRIVNGAMQDLQNKK